MKKWIAAVTQAGKRWLGKWLRQLAGLLLQCGQQTRRFLSSHILNQLLGRFSTRHPGGLIGGLIAGFVVLSLVGCSSQTQSVRLLELPELPSIGGNVKQLSGGKNDGILEVAPPAIFVDLAELMAGSQPQVAIAFPKPDQIIETTTLAVQITLRGLSIYKDEATNLGPHLQVILDNQPAQSIYSLDDPLEFLELAPGSHTLRVLAVKPWGESFKNATAYAQTAFHVFAKTGENTPSPNQPLLTYNEPQGSYGAEPILLDFYLSNAPLHLIAQDDPTLRDWKIRCDLNGQRFVFDQWQPMYLKGFKPGQNWVNIALIDEQGNLIKNAFNSTVRIVNYDPDERNDLAKMTRGELPLEAVGQIADPNYSPPIEPEIAPEVEPEIEAFPDSDAGVSLPTNETPNETPFLEETDEADNEASPYIDVSPYTIEETPDPPVDKDEKNDVENPDRNQIESLKPIAPDPETEPSETEPSRTLKLPTDENPSKFFSPFKNFDEFNGGSPDALSTEQPFVDEPTDELINEPTDELIDEPRGEPVHRPLDKPIDQATDEPADDKDLNELETPLPKTLKAPEILKEVIVSP